MIQKKLPVNIPTKYLRQEVWRAALALVMPTEMRGGMVGVKGPGVEGLRAEFFF